MTVHEIQENGTIKEIHQATGGPVGGEDINIKFRELLENIFSKRIIENYIHEHPVDWLYLMNDFERKKRGRRVCQGETTRIRLPASFVRKFALGKGLDINAFFQKHYSLKDIKLHRNEYLCLEAKVMRELFDPVLDQINRHLSNVFSKETMSGVKYVFLVGGFAESALLQERIKTHFGHSFRIIVPHHASIAVVRGALMLGQNPEVFQSRVMTASHGKSKEKVVDGIPRCKDIFFKFVRVDEVLRVSEIRRFLGFAPFTRDQKRIKFDNYQSEFAEAEFVTDYGMKKVPCQGLVLETPKAWKTTEINLIINFAYLNFLTKNEQLQK